MAITSYITFYFSSRTESLVLLSELVKQRSILSLMTKERSNQMWNRRSNLNQLIQLQERCNHKLNDELIFYSTIRMFICHSQISRTAVNVELSNTNVACLTTVLNYLEHEVYIWVTVTHWPLTQASVPGSYSRKQIVRTIEQRSYDLRRTDSQNVLQAVIVSIVGMIRQLCF